MTKVPNTSSNWEEMSLNKLMRLHDDLETAVHFNYMIDLQFVLDNHPNNAKLLLVSGDKLFSDQDNIPKYVFQCNVKMERYGTHHTKMSILKFKVNKDYQTKMYRIHEYKNMIVLVFSNFDLVFSRISL